MAEDAVIRDVRVSSRYVEFDVSIASERLESLLKRLSEIAPVAMCNEIVDKTMETEQAIEHAKNLFNSERYWECHEVLESVWKYSAGNEKLLLQAIILTCAAFVHSQKAEDDICISILDRAIAKFQNAKGLYYGIDVGRLKQVVADMLATKNIQHFKI